MKKILCLAFVLFTSIGIFAQEKIIQKEEFDKMYNTSIRLLSGKVNREIETETLEETPISVKNRSKVAPPIKFTRKEIIEVVPGVGTHSVIEYNSRLGNTKTEWFSVDGKQYTRKGEGVWLVRIVKGAKSKSSSKSENTVNNPSCQSLNKRLINLISE